MKFLAQLMKIKGNMIDDVAIKGNFSFATVPEKAGLAAVEASRKNPDLPTITLAHQDKPAGKPKSGGYKDKRDNKFDRGKKQDWGKKPDRKSRKKK